MEQSFIDGLIGEAELEKSVAADELSATRRANAQEILALMWARLGPLQGELVQFKEVDPEVGFSRGQELPGSIHIRLRMDKWDDPELAMKVDLKIYALEIGRRKVSETAVLDDGEDHHRAEVVYELVAGRIGLTDGTHMMNTSAVDLPEDWHVGDWDRSNLIQLLINVSRKYETAVAQKLEGKRNRARQRAEERKLKIIRWARKLDFTDSVDRADRKEEADEALRALIELNPDAAEMFHRMSYMWNAWFEKREAERERKAKLRAAFVDEFADFIRAFELVYARNLEIAEHLQTAFDADVELFQLTYQTMGGDEYGIKMETENVMVTSAEPDEDGFYITVGYWGERGRKKFFNVTSVEGPIISRIADGKHSAVWADESSPMSSESHKRIGIRCADGEQHNVKRAYEKSMVEWPVQPSPAAFELDDSWKSGMASEAERARIDARKIVETEQKAVEAIDGVIGVITRSAQE